MRIIRNIFIGLVGLIAVLAIVGLFLPRHVVVERDIIVNAAPEAVFPHVSSLQAFSEWSPWGDYDPNMQVTFTGPESGVGNVMEWASDHPNVGNGRQEIVEMVENQSIRTALAFDGMPPAEAWWRLVPEGDATRVVWGLDADMGGSPVNRWFGLMLPNFVGADYERGLAQLQTAIEG